MLRRLFLLAFVFVATTATFCSLACVLAIVVCLEGSWFVACAWSVATTAIVASFPAVVASRFELDDETLEDDLRRLATIVDLDAFASSRHDVEDVRRYYAATTFRDYRLLARFAGSDAMHTPLQKKGGNPPLTPLHLRGHGGFEGGNPPPQVHRVLTHVPLPSGLGEEPGRVLEIGFGKGVNTAFLASASPSTRFFGLDVAPEHVEHAKKITENASFFLGDASRPPPEVRANGPYALVFGIESLCYLDTKKKMESFLAFAETNVEPGGRIVIVDGFRPDDFEVRDAHSSNARFAMRLAESGMRLRRMASAREWKTLASRRGFVVVDEVDLTGEALPFWTRGWRVARAVLVFARGLVARYRASDPARAETFANLVSVCTTAHAMRKGTARYAALVLERETI